MQAYKEIQTVSILNIKSISIIIDFLLRQNLLNFQNISLLKSIPNKSEGRAEEVVRITGASD